MIETPFMAGKKYRADEVGNAAVQRANWRYATFGALGLSGLLALILLYALTLPRKIPVLYTVHEGSGEVHIIEQDFQKYVPPETAYVAQLRKDVETMRKVLLDKEEMRRQHVTVHTRLTEQGKRQYAQYLIERKLFDETEPITVDIIGTPLHDGGLTWDLRWRETRYGQKLDITTWRGKFTFVKAIPQNDKERDATPLGLFLDSWSWSAE
jgi:type IV secretory pathway TrbF-like protein